MEPDTLQLAAMENLQMDIILSEILPRLPAKSLARFKTVCKKFNNIISSAKFIQLHLRHSLSSDADRLLILPGNTNWVYAFDFDSPVSPASTFSFRQGGPASVSVVGSCNGLLCIVKDISSYDDDKELFLLNPTTRIYTLVPLQLEVTRRFVFGFGFDDANDDYKVVAISDYCYDNDSVVWVYSLTANSWRLVEPTLAQDCIEQGRVSSVCVLIDNHLLHWILWVPSESKSKIVCFNVRSEGWSDEVPLLEYYSDGSVRIFPLDIGVLDGSLCVLFHNLSKSAFDIWVMEKYGVKDSWSKLLSFPIMDEMRGIIPVASRRASGRHEVLLRRRCESKLYWYNTKNTSITRARFCGVPDFSSGDTCICKRSLVILPGGKQFTGA